MAVIVLDTFTAPDETTLETHEGETGAIWSVEGAFAGILPSTKVTQIQR